MDQSRHRGKQEPTRLHWTDIVRKQHRRTPAFLRDAQLREKIPKAMKHDVYLTKGLGYLICKEFAWRNITFYYKGTSQDFTDSQWELKPSYLLLWRVCTAMYQTTWVLMSASLIYKEREAEEEEMDEEEIVKRWLWPILSTNWHELIIGFYLLLALISFCMTRIRAKRVGPEAQPLDSKQEFKQDKNEKLSDKTTDAEGSVSQERSRDIVMDMEEEDLRQKTSKESTQAHSKISVKKEVSKASQKITSEPQPTNKSIDEKGPVEKKKSLPWYMKLQWALFYLCFIGTYPKIQFLTSGFNETYSTYDSLFSITLLLIAIETFMVNYPARFLHLWVSELFYFVYVGFTALYWYKGGINQNGKPYILWEYDWERPEFTAINTAVSSCILLPSIQALMVILVCLRKRIFLRQIYLQ